MATSSTMPPPTRRAMVVLFISMASEVLEELLGLDVFDDVYVFDDLNIFDDLGVFDMCLHHEYVSGVSGRVQGCAWIHL